MKKTTTKKSTKNEEHIDSNIFLSLFEHSISAILYGNPDTGDILDANPAAAQMFGYTIDELRNLNRNDIFDFKHHSMVNSLKKRQENGSAKGELIGIRKNGQHFPCEFSSSIFKNEKGENRTSTILNDISERIIIDEQKEFERQEKELLMNNIDALIWSVTTDFKLIAGNDLFNNSLKESLGVVLKPGDYVLNKNYFSKEVITVWENLYNRVILGNIINEEIFNPEFINTAWAWHSVNLKPIIKNNVIIGIFAHSRNISDKKNAQLKLKENAELFEKLTSNIPAALYKFEISSDGMMGFPYISKGIQKINPHIDIELIKTDVSSVFATVHPDDLEKLLTSIEVSKNNLSDWELEYRSIVSEDNIIWIKGKSSPEKRADGTIVWYGYFQDITEEKINTEKIRISKERYDIIAKATNDTIWDVDLLTDKVTWNKGIQGIYGYKADEPGMSERGWWYSKIHPDDAKRVRKSVESRMKNHESRWENEYRFCCADGSYKFVYDRGFLIVSDTVPHRMIGSMQDITERKQVEAKYLESELRFKTIFEAEPECVKLVGQNGKLIEINKAGLTMLEANSIEEVNSHALIDFVLPKYQSAYNKSHQQVMDGLECHVEYEAIGLRGTKRWMETNAVPIKDLNGVVTMVLSVTRDISNRKKEEHHLRLLESVITNTNDSIVITEAEPFNEPGPKIVFVNDAFTKMTGYTKEEVIGKSPRVLQGPKTDRDELKRMSESMKKWKPCEITVVNYKKNGEEFWINFSIKPIADEMGWFTHWIAVERDVTQQKNSELEREQIIAELSQNNKDLKQFSYVTSHNLRAPIANLLGLTSLIEQYKVPNKSLKQILDGVRQSALKFDDTVKDLTKVLVVKDQTNIVKEDVSFVTVIDNVLKQLSISVVDNDVKVNYEFGKAPIVSFTTAYLDSVLLNLFTNSIKYKSNKRKLKIDISSDISNDFVILKFKDNGIGIDTEKYKDKLFKLYQRFHDNPDGKGLGLYLIKSQIETLGGTIAIESQVEKGTTFTMKFKR